MKKYDNVKLLDRYQLLEELGHGGMGTVYRGIDELLQRPVAIKLLTGPGLGTEGKARMLQEARAAASLNHPNIVAVYDAGEQESDNIPFVIMEFVSGHNLAEKPPVDLDQTIDIVVQLCAALDHAHSHQIVHRDLKPANVLLTEDGIAKLVDFGLARSVASQLTVEGTIAGTLAYLPPELLLGQDFDGRADLYSLGVMLYQLTTGQLPFTADSPVALITQHLYAPVVPPRVHNPALPTALNRLIVNLLAKDTADRLSSAADVLSVLDQLDLHEEAALTEELTLLDRIVRGRMVSRERELAEARAVWTRAASGEGQILLIGGEPGIGKTRFTREMLTMAAVSGGRTLVGECFAEGGVPYAPFAQIVRGALEDGSPDDGEVEAIQTRSLPDFVLADLLRLAPELRAHYEDVPPNPRLDPESEQRRLFENVRTLFKVYSADQPLLIVLEDAHWADGGTLALMRHLARGMRRQSLMLVATYREVELDDSLPFNQVLMDLNRERLATRIKLSRLNREETGAMLRALFAQEITPGFVDVIYRETEGNPFFIEELCKSLVESGQLYYEDGAWQRPNMSEMSIPQSVRIAIQARVAKLTEGQQELLRIAAILGREFDFDTLAAASDLEEEELISSLESAERSQLIEEVAKAKGGTFSFAHALIPAALVESLSGLRQRRLHRKVGDVIEQLRPDDVAILAYHFSESADEEKALKYHTLAGVQASATYANQEAAHHFRAALELEPNAAKEADLLAELGVILSRQSRFNEALEVWKKSAQIYAESDNNRRLAWCYARMARAGWDSGEPPRGLELARAGLRLMGDAPDSPELADLLHETARACYFNGLIDEMIPLAERALEMATAERATRIEVEAMITLGLGSSSDPSGYEEARQLYQRAIDLSVANRLLQQEARARNNLSGIEGVFRGDVKSARQHLQRAAELSREVGDIDMECFTTAHGALFGIWMGDLNQVDDELTRLEDLVENNVDFSSGGMELAKSRTLLEFGRGSVEMAVNRFKGFHSEVKKGGDIQSLWELDFYLAEGLMELNELEEPEQYLVESIDIAEKGIGIRVRPLAYLSVLYSRRGEVVLARSLLEEVKTLIPAGNLPYFRTWYLLAEAFLAVAEKRWEDGWSFFSQLTADLESIGLRLVYAKTLTDWADCHLLRGVSQDTDRARELLLEAKKEFEEMGAFVYVEKLQARLEQLEESSA